MFSRIKAVTKKEIKQLFRDKRMLFVVLFFPVFLLGVFGYAVSFDVKNIQLAIYDLDKSPESRDLINYLTSSNYFQAVNYISADSEIKTTLDDQEAQVVLVIPNDFSKKLGKGNEEVKIQYLIDGVNGNTATIIYNYVKSATFNFGAKYQQSRLARLGKKAFVPVNLEPLFMFNPELNSTKFLLPGLIAMILIVTATITVSLSLVREKEKGTMEQLEISSLSTLEILFGKTLPYILISLLDAIFILVAGYLLFDVMVKGDYFILFISTMIFIISATSMGIFVSVVSDTQQIAFTMATFLSMLPSVILSGFIFPIESMPYIIQLVTNISPAKFFIIILRAIILRGVGLEAFWTQLLYLILFAVLFLGMATFASKKKALAK